MRTTVNIDADVLEFAKALADGQGVSIGEALSGLARRGMSQRVATRRDPVSGLVVFDVADDVPQISTEDVQKALDGESEDHVKYLRKP
jgi:hypothetical protein